MKQEENTEDMVYELSREIERSITGDWTCVSHSSYLPTLYAIINSERSQLLAEAKEKVEKLKKQYEELEDSYVRDTGILVCNQVLDILTEMKK